MPPDPLAYVWDAHRAASLVSEFVAGRSWDEYEADVMLRSAVERQFAILGEALNSLRRDDAGRAGQVPDLARIVAFRNVLIHGYATIDDRLVWEVATERVQVLLEALDGLLGQFPPPADSVES